MKRLILPLLLLVSGCGSYRGDIEMMCNAWQASGAQSAGGPMAMVTFGGYVEAHAKTKEFRSWVMTLTELSTPQKGERLRAEARRVGVSACPTADTWTTQQ